jgi:hypothetical protein
MPAGQKAFFGEYMQRIITPLRSAHIACLKTTFAFGISWVTVVAQLHSYHSSKELW